MIVFYFFGRIWHHFNRLFLPKISWIMALPYDTQNCHVPQWESSNKTWRTRAMTGPRSGIHPSPIDVMLIAYQMDKARCVILALFKLQARYLFCFCTVRHIKYSLRIVYSGPQSHKPAWINEPTMDFSQFVRIIFPCLSALILEALRTLFLVILLVT